MAKLNIVSLNVNGLRNTTKRKTLFRKFKENNFDVICLQESYITDEVTGQWKKEWGGDLVYTVGTARSKGQLVLIRKNLPYNWQVVTANQRLIIIKVKTDLGDIIICNAYAPNTDKDIDSFLMETSSLLNNSGIDRLIVCGDFNTVLDNNRDIISGDKHSDRSVETFNNFVDSCNLLDAWRLFNPEEKVFTWSRKVNGLFIARRLDYVLVNENVVDLALESNIVSFPQSDHRAVYVQIKCSNVERGPSYWKFNNALLKEKEYVNFMNSVIDTFNEDNTITAFSDDVRWELFKLKCREETMKYSRERSLKIKNKSVMLQNELNTCESALAKNPNDINFLQKRDHLNLQLDLIETEKTRSAQVRAKVKWIEEGEKNTKYFLNLEKARANARFIPKLVLEDNTIVTDQHEILTKQKEYFEKLYHKTPETQIKEDQVDSFLGDCVLPKLSEDECASCEGIILVDELSAALKIMKNGSSPGLDGLTTEFMKMFWLRIRDILVKSLNVSFNNGHLTFSQSGAIITLIHKGKELEKSNLSNWRPISLTNTDYKIVAKCIAMRLSRVIKTIVNEDQVGYIKGRNVSANLRLIDDVIEYSRIKKQSGILLALDFSKAFDSISKEFMIIALKKFGFGKDFIRWTRVLMTNTRSRIGYNGWMSEDFDVLCGIRQGCPFSPLAFIVGLELLACKFRSSSLIKGIMIKNPSCLEDTFRTLKNILYADDVTMFLRDINDLDSVLFILEQFKLISGLAVNKTKSEAMWLGPQMNENNNKHELRWVQKIKILGIYFSNSRPASLLEENWNDRIKCIKQVIQTWEKRNLSIFGKICIIKTFLLSQFVYVMKAITLHEKVLTEINTILYRFLWRKTNCNRRAFEKVKRCVMTSSPEKGGLNMIDLKLMQSSFQCEWLIKLSNATNECKWSWIPRFYFSVFGKNMAFLNSTVGQKKFKGKDEVSSVFWSNALKTWLDHNVMQNQSKKLKLECIWNNRNIVYQGSVIYFKNWALKGITFVNDLWQDNVFVSINHIKDVIGPSSSLYLEYFVLRVAITSFLKKNDYKLPKNTENQDIYFNGEILQNAKMFRNVITKERHSSPCSERFWHNKFDLSITEKHWVLARKLTSESRLRELHWKILHNIYPTRILLFKLKLAPNNKCPYCLAETDYIEHFFFYCPKIKPIWKCVQDEFYAKFEKNILLSVIDILFGVLVKPGYSICMINHLNYLILVAKMCIGKFRYGKSTCVDYTFKYELALRGR